MLKDRRPATRTQVAPHTFNFRRLWALPSSIRTPAGGVWYTGYGSAGDAVGGIPVDLPGHQGRYPVDTCGHDAGGRGAREDRAGAQRGLADASAQAGENNRAVRDPQVHRRAWITATNSVLGPRDTAGLGLTLPHEHLIDSFAPQESRRMLTFSAAV